MGILVVLVGLAFLFVLWLGGYELLRFRAAVFWTAAVVFFLAVSQIQSWAISAALVSLAVILFIMIGGLDWRSGLRLTRIEERTGITAEDMNEYERAHPPVFKEKCAKCGWAWLNTERPATCPNCGTLQPEHPGQ